MSVNDPAQRGHTWLGPFTIDGTRLYVHRHEPNSAPHTLPVPDSRRWDMIEADPDDPSSPRCNDQCAMVVLPNAAGDEEALRRLGIVEVVKYKEGWGPDGALPLPEDQLQRLQAFFGRGLVGANLQAAERRILPERVTPEDQWQVERGKRNPIRRRPSFEGVEVVHVHKPASLDDYRADRITLKKK